MQSVSPVVNANSVTLTYDGTTYSPSTFIGTTPSYEQARSYSTTAGSWFTSAQESAHSRVLIVGPTVVSELFGGQDPVGDTVQVNGTNYVESDRGALPIFRVGAFPRPAPRTGRAHY